MRVNAIPRLIVALALIFAVQSAWAIDIHSAKSQGLVGEANTGYLAARGTPNEEVKALVAEVNQKRRAEFQDAAKKTGATVQQVQRRFYELAVQRTQSGNYYQNESGAWQKK